MKLALYWHTLRYLKTAQLFGRLWIRLYHPHPNLDVAPDTRPAQGVWQPVAQRRASWLAEGSFVFLNQPGQLADLGWDGPQREKLWRYNQHYFDDLNAKQAASRMVWHQNLLQDWVARNPAGVGNGWEPYPTSLRIVNWVKWAAAGNRLTPTCSHSLAIQARWLRKRLEWHLLGNHLLANAKALIFAGLFFEGDEANRWLAKGLTIVAAQLPEQVLADGGNFERSPMYHALCLEDVLDLINASQHWPGLVSLPTQATWRETATRMLAWLATMLHPDGELALFNDTAHGIAPTAAELVAYAARLGVTLPAQCEASQGMVLTQLKETGYLRLATSQAVLLIDAAPVGPDYLPGHAHADTLSFELSVRGQRLVVNGGTSRYGLGPERQRERETAQHSTVEVDGFSSSEVWGGFRVARRAKPFDLVVQQEPAHCEVTCSHDGYQRLPGRPVHRRRWDMTGNRLKVQDVVTGQHREAIARFILHPTVQLEADGPQTWWLNLPGLAVARKMARFRAAKGRVRMASAQYADEFGRSQATACLEVVLDNGCSDIEILWE